MLKVTNVITENNVATRRPIPDPIGHFFDVIEKNIPIIAPIRPKIINVFPAAFVVAVVDSPIELSPAAQAPEHTDAGKPKTPPIIPKTIGAFEVPLTFDIVTPP